MTKEKEVKKKEETYLRNIKKEADVWKFFNRFRNEKESVKNHSKLKDWKEHFKMLLNGSDSKITGEKRDKKKQKI